MGLAVLYSRGLAGMDAALVTVEVHLANGLPNFTIVGLPEAEVKESKDRVRAALLEDIHAKTRVAGSAERQVRGARFFEAIDCRLLIPDD